VAGCHLDRACVARALAETVEKGSTISDVEDGACRLSLVRPRPGEVLVLGQLDGELAVQKKQNGTWRHVGAAAGDVHIDGRASDPSTDSVLWAMPAGRQWLHIKRESASKNVGEFYLKLKPAFRRPGGGGSSEPGVRGELTVDVAAYFELPGLCESKWHEATVTVAYRSWVGTILWRWFLDERRGAAFSFRYGR